MTRAALDAGTATRHHGAGPHLIIVAPQQVATGQHTGVVQTAFSGPLPAGEGLRIVDDDAVSKLICDDRTIPVEATEEVRNVPAGVFRVFVRDGGRCIAEGCDITAAWCEVMHLTVPTGSTAASPSTPPASAASTTTPNSTTKAGRSPGSTDDPSSTTPTDHPTSPPAPPPRTTHPTGVTDDPAHGPTFPGRTTHAPDRPATGEATRRVKRARRRRRRARDRAAGGERDRPRPGRLPSALDAVPVSWRALPRPGEPPRSGRVATRSGRDPGGAGRPMPRRVRPRPRSEPSRGRGPHRPAVLVRGALDAAVTAADGGDGRGPPPAAAVTAADGGVGRGPPRATAVTAADGGDGRGPPPAAVISAADGGGRS
jgi:hypothetical protein